MKRLPTPSQNVCGKYVRNARNNYGKRHHTKMTQADLAAKLQLKGMDYFDRLAVCRIENGTRKVSDIELKYLAAALEVSVVYLLYGPVNQIPDFDALEALVAEGDEFPNI